MIGKGFARMMIGAVLVVVMGLAGCAKSDQVKGSSAVKVNENQVGQQVTLKQDQTLAVRLESNPTTGYGWEVAECDTAVLQAQGEPVYEQANQSQNLAGGGGWQTFTFKPVKVGETKLKLVYRRSWEKGVEPIKTYEVTVKVE